jgi:hypothetical protein
VRKANISKQPNVNFYITADLETIAASIKVRELLGKARTIIA